MKNSGTIEPIVFNQSNRSISARWRQRLGAVTCTYSLTPRLFNDPWPQRDIHYVLSNQILVFWPHSIVYLAN